MLYFSTQQDISIEEDRDHRKRRLVLRLKCLFTIATCSLLSLLVLVAIVQIGERTWAQMKMDGAVTVRNLLREVSSAVDGLVKEEL